KTIKEFRKCLGQIASGIHLHPSFWPCNPKVLDQACGRISRIENDEGRAGFKNAEQSQHERRAAVRVDRDDVLRLNSASYKIVRQLVAARVEFTVCPQLVGINNSRSIRHSLSLPGKQLVDGPFPSIVKRFSRVGQNRLRGWC